MAILLGLIRLKINPGTLVWKLWPLRGLRIGLFIPMGGRTPASPAPVGRGSVVIVRGVSGEALLRIAPAPFEARPGRMTGRVRPAAPQFDIEQGCSEVDRFRAEAAGARGTRGRTTARPPADGCLTKMTLRRGAPVSHLSLAPAMAFIDTSDTIAIVQVPQIHARDTAPGQKAEGTFALSPARHT